MKALKLMLTLSLSLSAIIGDYIVFKSAYSNSQVFRAFSDSAVHGTIGFLSALVFFSHEINISRYACIINVVLCTFMSSIIDIDHFLVARSIYIKDLAGITQRGIFHCTTLWILVTILLFTYSNLYKKLNIYVLTWMITLAYTSHHIRDANRRGLWMWPFSHTVPIPKSWYIVFIAVLPHVCGLMYVYTKPSIYKHSVVNLV